MSECGYEGQVLDRQVTSAWLHVSAHHHDAEQRAARLGEEMDAAGLRWKIGIRSSSSILVAIYAERTATRALRRHFTLFKTWLSPEINVADDREWMEGPLRQAFARAGLADAHVEYSGEAPYFG